MPIPSHVARMSDMATVIQSDAATRPNGLPDSHQRPHDLRGSAGSTSWTVTTTPAMVGEHELQSYKDARSAFDDFGRRIRQLELAGFRQEGEETAEYGRRWSRDYVRGEERVTIRVDRPRRTEPSTSQTA